MRPFSAITSLWIIAVEALVSFTGGLNMSHSRKHPKALVHPPDSKDLKHLLKKYSGAATNVNVTTDDMAKVVSTLHFAAQFEHCKEELGGIELFREKINKHDLVGYVEQGPFFFLFFLDATCVRWPNDADPDKLPPYQLEILRETPYLDKLQEKESAGEVLFDTGEDGRKVGLEPGLFIDTSGRVFVMRPPPRFNLELVVPGNPGDVPLNYKC
jgi:hypothetical protein